MPRLNVDLPPDLHDRVKRACEEEMRSQRAVVVLILRDHFAAIDNPTPWIEPQPGPKDPRL